MSEILDESAVSEIEDRAAKATPPPWHTAKRRPALVVAEDRARVADCHVGIGMAVDEAQFNSEFIAHAREDIPALCATVKHLRADAKLVDEYVAEVKRELGMKPNWHLSITLERYKEKVQSEVRAEMQSQLEQLRAENEVLRSEIKEKERGDFDWKQSRP